MNCYDNLKNNLKFLRNQNNESQQYVADKLEISRVNLSRYETGENAPPLDILIKLADYYDTSLDDLLRTSFSNKNDNNK